MWSEKFEQRVSAYITSQGLLNPGARVGVALSGGADSVALLLCLYHLHFDIVALHCNFHLRDAESDHDETFCRQLCERLGMPLLVTQFNTKSYAREHGISIEMAARQQRYDFFSQMTDRHALQAVCVAHHQDDNIETMFINMLRGTGLTGLTGMKGRTGDVVRPLLCVGREDIEHYLHELGESFVTDSSNLVADVLRNKVRLHLLPMLQQWNASTRKCLLRTMTNLSYADNYLQQTLTRRATQCKRGIDDDAVPTEEAWRVNVDDIDGELFLHHLLSPYGFRSSEVNDLYSKLHQDKPVRYLSPGYECVLWRGELFVWRRRQPFQPVILQPEQEHMALVSGRHLKMSEQKWSQRQIIPTSQTMACMDKAKIAFPLTVRTLETGDSFRPLGMKGSQLVSDFLTNHHATPYQRAHQCVVVDAHGNICWIVGWRIADTCRVTTTTTDVIFLEVE